MQLAVATTTPRLAASRSLRASLRRVHSCRVVAAATGGGAGGLTAPKRSPLPAVPTSRTSFAVLFTDLDGTCVHYQSPIGRGRDGRPVEILQLPPSKTGTHGIISVRTLQYYAVIRQLGVKLVLTTGARLATTLQRLPFLPAADAIVAEGGGRIYYPGSLPTACPLQEDAAWRQVHEAAGPPGYDAVPPEERPGALWQLYAAIQAGKVPGLEEGVKLDAVSYTTAFRMRLARPEQTAALQAALGPELATACNLGSADVFPATSGKDKAALHLMQRWGVQPLDCVFMCDDDNDLELARLVRKAYLPGITADTMRAAVEAAPSQFHVSSCHGVWGTEELLELLISEHMAWAHPTACEADF
ncbi:MAG: hypothetical protein J3K34DRAFT_381927 [Monoraphidium minutum]|nr:MAG: hypothetical protein J3K34DRAFT_381927 [Monoraphidium minutum]